MARRELQPSPLQSPPNTPSVTSTIAGDDTETFLEARCRRERSAADKSEIERAQLQGLLTDRAGVGMATETAFRQIRDTVIGVPDRSPIDAVQRTMARDALLETVPDAVKMLPKTMTREVLQ